MSDRKREIFEELKALTTERRNPATRRIDRASTSAILELMNAEDRKVADAVALAIPDIARAVDLVADSFANDGRLLYFGAGTSGRLGVLDAAECPPTFGAAPEMVVGVIAGGRDTMFLSREGVEDDEGAAADDVRSHDVAAADTVIGISASRRTPYPIAALAAAKGIGASTVFLSCNPSQGLDVDVEINVVVGPEAITGSTRLKSGSAQKMVLNMITTASMVKVGKIYENLMVDLKPASEKLEARAKSIIALLADVDYERALAVYQASDRNLKTAIVMAKLGVGRDDARAALERADGLLARALGETS